MYQRCERRRGYVVRMKREVVCGRMQYTAGMRIGRNNDDDIEATPPVMDRE